MVDLHFGACIVPALEIYRCPGVGVVQRTGKDDTVVRAFAVSFIGQIPVEDIISGIASIMVNVFPAVGELVA